MTRRLERDFKGDVSSGKLRWHLKVLRELMQSEMRKHLFFCIDEKMAAYYQQERLFGDRVYVAFESARTDISDAGTCRACGNYTASVFHLMRAAEYGLRTLAKRLRVKLTDKGKRQPIESATWDKVITQAKNRIADARNLSAGPKRQSKLELWSDAADHCLFMKDIWRNNVSHTRKPYKSSEAKAALERVQEFMTFLAVHLA
jgi:hypothetical protein